MIIRLGQPVCLPMTFADGADKLTDLTQLPTLSLSILIPNTTDRWPMIKEKLLL